MLLPRDFILRCTFCFLTTLFAEAQELRGRIVSRATDEPLAYSSIGISGKSLGTVCDESGNFSFSLAAILPSDTLVISCLGYETQKLPIGKVKAQEYLRIRLHEKAYVLPSLTIQESREVVYIGKKSKAFNGFTGWGGFNDQLKGKERGVLIPVDNQRVFIRKAFVRIRDNTYDSALFRLHFYRAQNGVPGEELVQKNILFTSGKPNESLTIDVSSDSILLDEDFFACVEWLKSWGPYKPDHQLTIALVNTNSLFCFKEGPHDKWNVYEREKCPAIYLETFITGVGAKTVDISEDKTEHSVALSQSASGESRSTSARRTKEKQESSPGNRLKKVGITEHTKYSDGGDHPINKNTSLEYGTLITPIAENAVLVDFNFHLAYNEYDSVYFLFNIYSFDKMKKAPSGSLLVSPINFVIGKDKGWIRVDLKKYNIQITDDVVVTVKPVLGISRNKKSRNLFFSKYPSGTSFTRSTGQPWSSDDAFSYSFFVRVKN